MNNKEKEPLNNNFWKSLKDYYSDPDILKAKTNEFMDQVTDDFNPDNLSGLSRRKFLALLSASAAFSVTACTDYRDKGQIVPYNHRPEEIQPGTPTYYASTCGGCANKCGIVVKTREGRPIKIDGNPDHPVNKGKICAKGQASIYDLYDPERLEKPTRNKRKTSWKEVDRVIVDALTEAAGNGREIVLWTNRLDSPSTLAVIEDFKSKYKTVKVYSYEAFTDEVKFRAWKKCYGDDSMPSVEYNKADVILSIDSDFLGREGNYVENARQFTERRDIMKSQNFNRLYVAESGMSLTGMNADYRFRIRPDELLDYTMCLISEIALRENASEINLEMATINKLKGYSLTDFIEKSGIDEKKTRKLIFDLIQNKGHCIVVAGNTSGEEVQIAVNFLNEVLGNKPVYDFGDRFTNLTGLSGAGEIADLTDKMRAGKVGVVIHFDSNPVYELPPELNYAEALGKVGLTVTMAGSENETSALSNIVVPVNHYLESWGFFRVRTGNFSTQQPLIAPLFDTRQKEAVLMTWAIGSGEAYSEEMYQKYIMDFVRTEFYSAGGTGADFASYWESLLHDGAVRTGSGLKEPGEFNFELINNMPGKSGGEGLVLHLRDSYYLGNGKFANNGWLQEMPHPVTKITWDNYAAVSPGTAGELNLSNDDMVEIAVEDRKLNIPVFIQPGMADNSIVIETGYGRNVVGDVGAGVGFDANVLTTLKHSYSPYIYSGVKLRRIDGTHKLASTQEHHAIDDSFVKDFHLQRKIIQEGTVAQYKDDHEFLHKDHHEIFSITDDVEYTGMKWAMAIDLNKCISCGACAVACNVENNVPVVGKDQVELGREMQWMRIDRYYSGTPEDPIVSNQPMLCQHCDNAPCENVCPVNATNHSEDGLNQMAYNRCVGTRYCANNCPYKVRRFNFYNFRDHFADAYYQNSLTDLVNNPEVTVRSRGVMEKCTFCVQRIMEARSDAIKEGRELKGSEVLTACQEACPSQAIVFGNSNDLDSEVAKYRKHDLAYHVLDYLNVRPNITYLAKLRNIDSEDA